jgi:hypothetical protein
MEVQLYGDRMTRASADRSGSAQVTRKTGWAVACPAGSRSIRLVDIDYGLQSIGTPNANIKGILFE